MLAAGFHPGKWRMMPPMGAGQTLHTVMAVRGNQLTKAHAFHAYTQLLAQAGQGLSSRVRTSGGPLPTQRSATSAALCVKAAAGGWQGAAARAAAARPAGLQQPTRGAVQCRACRAMCQNSHMCSSMRRKYPQCVLMIVMMSTGMLDQRAVRLIVPPAWPPTWQLCHPALRL